MKVADKNGKEYEVAGCVAIGSYSYFILVDSDGKFTQMTIDQVSKKKPAKKKK